MSRPNPLGDDELIAAWARLTRDLEPPVRSQRRTIAARASVAPVIGTLGTAAILVAALAAVRLGIGEPETSTSSLVTASPSATTSPPTSGVPASSAVPKGVELLPSTTRMPECTHHDRQWIVRLESGERFGDLFPNADRLDDLGQGIRQVNEPLLVSTYPDGWRFGSGGMGTSPNLEPGEWAICLAVESGQETLYGGTSATLAVPPAGSFLLQASEPAGLRPGVLAEAIHDAPLATGHTGHGEMLATIKSGERAFILDDERPDGEPWYRAQYWDHRTGEMIVGWIDGAGLALVAPACPAAVTLGSVVALAPYERLICFGSDLLTFEGTVVRVLTDGSPSNGVTWLAGASRDWLAEDTGRDPDAALALRVDPSAPVTLPLERRLIVLGRFNDRAASACSTTRRGGDLADEARLWCQEQFVAAAAAEPGGWGPLAVALDEGHGALTASGGIGPLRFGERCVTLLRENGTETTLVWRSGETRWDGAAREIVWTDPSGREIRLSDGIVVAVGGADIAPPDSPDQGAGQPTWLKPPDPSCPEELFSLHSIDVEGQDG